MNPMKLSITLLLGIIFLTGCNSNSKEEKDLALAITNNENFQLVKEKARDLIESGFNAGEGYGAIWIRDLNTFMELSCEVVDQKIIHEKLIVFFKFQGSDGNIVDGYRPWDAKKKKKTDGAIYSDLAPDFFAHKNTVETDHETSLIQGVFKYVMKTGDKEMLKVDVGGMTVAKRMEFALEFLMNQRYNEDFGLIWGGTTADWGDVQPEDLPGVLLSENTHYALDIYDNAMLVIAIKNFIELMPDAAVKWSPVLEQLQINIMKQILLFQMILMRTRYSIMEAQPLPLKLVC